MTFNGRVVFASHDLPRRTSRRPLPTDAQGRVMTDFRVLPDSPRAPFKEGVPYFDQDQGVEYRVVRAATLKPEEGWASLQFWAARWKRPAAFVFECVRKGWLDAAIELHTENRRFRCRDEYVVKEQLKQMMYKERGQKVAARYAERQQLRTIWEDEE